MSNSGLRTPERNFGICSIHSKSQQIRFSKTFLWARCALSSPFHIHAAQNAALEIKLPNPPKISRKIFLRIDGKEDDSSMETVAKVAKMRPMRTDITGRTRPLMRENNTYVEQESTGE